MKKLIQKLSSKNCKYTKLSGNSILESVIALSIMATVIAISISITTLLYNSQKDIDYYRATQKINELQWETINNKLFNNDVYSFGNIEIIKTITNYDNNNSLKQIDYSFTLNKITFHKSFLYFENND